MTPEEIIEGKIKVKEFNNKFFGERIEAKKLEIKKLQEDCERLEGLIQLNLDRINELKQTSNGS
jgi:hypothetical protein